MEVLRHRDLPLFDTQGRVADVADRMVSANAYLGAGPIVEALADGADIVITGRVSDPALFLAPLMHEFGWARTTGTGSAKARSSGISWNAPARSPAATSSILATRTCPILARLGFPLADVSEDGSAVIGKLPGTGGR